MTYTKKSKTKATVLDTIINQKIKELRTLDENILLAPVCEALEERYTEGTTLEIMAGKFDCRTTLALKDRIREFIDEHDFLGRPIAK